MGQLLAHKPAERAKNSQPSDVSWWKWMMCNIHRGPRLAFLYHQTTANVLCADFSSDKQDKCLELFSDAAQQPVYSSFSTSDRLAHLLLFRFVIDFPWKQQEIWVEFL